MIYIVIKVKSTLWFFDDLTLFLCFRDSAHYTKRMVQCLTIIVSELHLLEDNGVWTIGSAVLNTSIFNQLVTYDTIWWLIITITLHLVNSLCECSGLYNDTQHMLRLRLCWEDVSGYYEWREWIWESIYIFRHCRRPPCFFESSWFSIFNIPFHSA